MNCTDEQIIKVLEEMSIFKVVKLGSENVLRPAADLIKRLKAENEELKSDLIMKTNDYENVKSLYENSINIGQRILDKLVIAYKQLKTAKSEARKEFAERFEKEVGTIPAWGAVAIKKARNLLEEMEKKK